MRVSGLVIRLCQTIRASWNHCEDLGRHISYIGTLAFRVLMRPTFRLSRVRSIIHWMNFLWLSRCVIRSRPVSQPWPHDTFSPAETTQALALSTFKNPSDTGFILLNLRSITIILHSCRSSKPIPEKGICRPPFLSWHLHRLPQCL